MADINTKEELYYPQLGGRLTDFIGFQFNGVHSSELGIVRTSDGSRYNENLISNFQDKTAQMPGSDETLYWESFYSNRSWNISIAFDNMSEYQFRRMRQVFNGKDMGTLIFDESPYKAYTVKVQSPPQLKFICFNEGNERVYKGEGTIQFISYKPYARSVKKFLSEYSNIDYPNKNEWAAASGMKNTQGSYDGTNATTIYLYNAGDVETDWIAYYSITSSGCLLTQISLDSGTNGIMGFSSISRLNDSDNYIRVNSKTNLIEGCTSLSGSSLTGSVYNRFLVSGDFFKIPLGDSTFTSTDANCVQIEYNYLYY